MLTRRSAIAALPVLLAATALRAQGFPTRPITIIVPYPAGGSVDLLARLVARDTQPLLGQTVTVENRGGAAGVVGTRAAAQAEPDGHTLILGTNQTHATNQSLVKDSPDAVKDFTPVAGLGILQHVLVVRKDLAAQNVADLIALSKTKPGGLNIGSSGRGSASHLAAELFAKVTGMPMTHVPFAGVAPLVNGMMTGTIDASFATLSTVLGQVQSGEIRVLAVASATRATAIPNVPTLREQGVSGVEADAWFALFAPAKTPAAAVDRLYQAIAAAAAIDTFKSTLAAQGFTVALRPPAEMAAWLPGEVEKWAAVIRDAGITPQ
ncbi:MAG: tripartite tricarboxylate transporter substrate binding protein [Pseudolabrys sp.]|nr:tripartite tricarboxylate transporter substrate binding protein [Pseudolabrys sp.]